MAYQDLIVEPDGALLKVTLNRPETLNTLSIRAMTELEDLALSLRHEPGVRVVVLTGAAGTFSAGMDLKDPEIGAVASAPVAERRRLALLGQRLCQAWEDVEPITIAAIEGFCLGGAVSLVIACDFRIMGRSGYMRVPEIDLGMNYSWGSIPRLLGLIGPARTKQVVMLAEKVPAQTCLDWGLAEEVVDDGSAVDAALVLAGKILAKPPLPVVMTKRAVNRLSTALDRTGSDMDADQFVLTTYTDEHRARVAAFFQKKTAGPEPKD